MGRPRLYPFELSGTPTLTIPLCHNKLHQMTPENTWAQYKKSRTNDGTLVRIFSCRECGKAKSKRQRIKLRRIIPCKIDRVAPDIEVIAKSEFPSKPMGFDRGFFASLVRRLVLMPDGAGVKFSIEGINVRPDSLRAVFHAADRIGMVIQVVLVGSIVYVQKVGMMTKKKGTEN